MSDDCINANRLNADSLVSLRGSTVTGYLLFGREHEEKLEARIKEALEAAEQTDSFIEATDCGRIIEPEPLPPFFLKDIGRDDVPER